jgi:hypothetical protein
MTASIMRRVLVAGAVCLALAAGAYAALERTLRPSAAGIHVRWTVQADDIDRQAAEQRYRLTQGSPGDARTWTYLLTDTSQENVRALVTDPSVEDTSNIDRVAFRVDRESTRGRPPQALRPRAAANLRLAAILTGLLGLVAISLGVAGLVAPGLTSGVLAARSVAVAPLSRTNRALLALILGASIALNVTGMRRMTMTADEPEHLRYGRGILALDSSRFDDSKMPITALNAIAGAIAGQMPPGVVAIYLARPETSRYATVVFSTLTALCVFAWARRLYGPHGALLAAALYAFDPNVLAHAQLTTTDVYAAGTIAIALYFFWRFVSEGGWRMALASALTLGLAQVAKYTSIVLFPLCALVAALHYSPAILRAVRASQWRDLGRGVTVFAAAAIAFGAVSLLLLNVAYVFNLTLTPFDQYAFHSDVLRKVQTAVGVLGLGPVPIPYPYLEGLDMVMDHERSGTSFGRLYLFGQLSDTGFAGYYLWTCLYKMPLATQAVLVAATVAYFARRRYRAFLQNEVFLLVPVAFFAIYFNFFYRAQIGIRYFLVVFPLAYVFAAGLLAGQAALARSLRAGVATAVAFLLASVLSYYPHFLAYFNELVPDRTQAYRIVADSNLDWGQYGYYLEEYRRKNPGSVWEPDTPVAGTILVRANVLVGIVGDPERFRWLRDGFRPAGHIAHGILVYRITQADLDALPSRR